VPSGGTKRGRKQGGCGESWGAKAAANSNGLWARASNAPFTALADRLRGRCLGVQTILPVILIERIDQCLIDPCLVDQCLVDQCLGASIRAPGRAVTGGDAASDRSSEQQVRKGILVVRLRRAGMWHEAASGVKPRLWDPGGPDNRRMHWASGECCGRVERRAGERQR
jgi:hypothetical protein